MKRINREIDDDLLIEQIKNIRLVHTVEFPDIYNTATLEKVKFTDRQVNEIVNSRQWVEMEYKDNDLLAKYLTFDEAVELIEDLIQGDCDFAGLIDPETGDEIEVYHDIREQVEAQLEGHSDFEVDDFRDSFTKTTYKEILLNVGKGKILQVLIMGMTETYEIYKIPNRNTYLALIWR